MLRAFYIFQYINIVLHYLAVYIHVILKPPTASWYFWGSGARTAGCVSRVRVLSSISSAKGPSSGPCEPEGSVGFFYEGTYVVYINFK